MVHTNAGSRPMISRMGEEPQLESGRETVGGAHAGAGSGLAGFSTSQLREWLPGVFAARLLAGVRLPSGRMVGETNRVVHLFPIPAGRMVPDELRALCGLPIRPGQAELVKVGSGMPCMACVMAVPDLDSP